MRVHLHLSQRIAADTIGYQFYTLLERSLSSLPDVILTTEHPDIVHLLGNPQADNARLLTTCARLKIPTLLSPLSSLQPWHLPTQKPHLRNLALFKQKAAVQKATALHAWSLLEEKNLKSLQWNQQIHGITNALVTQQITAEAMVEQLQALYAQLIAAHDTKIKEDIDKHLASFGDTPADITNICRQVLYIFYLFRRENIPQSTLKALSRTLTLTTYDEEQLAATLQQLKLLPFMASLEQVMSEHAELTEGFMPIPFADDKQAENIRKTITHYKP